MQHRKICVIFCHMWDTNLLHSHIYSQQRVVSTPLIWTLNSSLYTWCLCTTYCSKVQFVENSKRLIKHHNRSYFIGSSYSKKIILVHGQFRVWTGLHIMSFKHLYLPTVHWDSRHAEGKYQNKKVIRTYCLWYTVSKTRVCFTTHSSSARR